VEFEGKEMGRVVVYSLVVGIMYLCSFMAVNSRTAWPIRIVFVSVNGRE
jgi:hypothetical protein